MNLYVESNEQNRNRGMDAWNRQPSEEKGEGDCMKEGEGISQRYAHMHNP